MIILRHTRNGFTVKLRIGVPVVVFGYREDAVAYVERILDSMSYLLVR